MFFWANVYYVIQSRQWTADKHVLCPKLDFCEFDDVLQKSCLLIVVVVGQNLLYEIRVLDPKGDPFVGPIASATVDWQYENMIRRKVLKNNQN